MPLGAAGSSSWRARRYSVMGKRPEPKSSDTSSPKRLQDLSTLSTNTASSRKSTFWVWRVRRSARSRGWLNDTVSGVYVPKPSSVLNFWRVRDS
jgi:hypothetical protein